MRKTLTIFVILAAACGSDSAEPPPCPETWERANASCSPADREFTWSVYATASENSTNLDKSVICQVETTDRNARFNAWKNDYGVVARGEDCVVRRELSAAESEEGTTKSPPTGMFTIQAGEEVYSHGQTEGTCVANDPVPGGFLAPGNTYIVSSDGVDAESFEYEVSLPASATYQTSASPDGINVTWSPFGSDRVSIRFEQQEPYRELICETDDDGEFIVPERFLLELQPGAATFRIQGENVILHQLDDGTRVLIRGAVVDEQTFYFQ